LIGHISTLGIYTNYKLLTFETKGAEYHMMANAGTSWLKSIPTGGTVKEKKNRRPGEIAKKRLFNALSDSLLITKLRETRYTQETGMRKF